MYLTRAPRRIPGMPCAFLTLVALLLTARAAGGIASGASASPQQMPTVLDVYRHVQAVLRRPGMLYHSTIRTQSASRPVQTSAVQQELWVDAWQNVARSDETYTYTVTDPSTHRSQTTRGRSTSITTGQAVFNRAGPPERVNAVEPQLCHGKQLLAAGVVLGCPGPTTRSTTRVQSGQYAGRAAVVLVTRGTTEGEDQNTTTTTRLYLDPATYLPMVSATSGIMDAGKKYPLSGTGRYTHAFVLLSHAPKGFFDPANIGYQPPAVTVGRQLDRLPTDFTPYWLGTRFARDRNLPALVINGLDRGDTGGPGYLFTLFYTPENHRYGAPVVALEEWRASNPLPRSSNGPCYGRVMARPAIPGGKAEIYTSHGLIGCAFFHGTTVVVQTPFHGTINGEVASPYASRAGLEAVLRELRPRARGS